MNLGQLKTKLLEQIFVSGQPENLIASHNSMFEEALYGLQKDVECYRYNNSSRFPHCSTYFNCGMTVLPKPQGHILKVYVIDRLDEDGNESADGEDDECQKVTYQQVDFCHIESYIKLAQRCSSAPAVVDALVGNLFGIYRTKRRYPAPTDEGLGSLPPLPSGFHYPQESTDTEGRSPSGVWAIYRGRIYIAPWIQSTETVVIEWNGIKRQWSDADDVDDDPKLHQFVRTHVMWQHEKLYGDPAKARDLEIQIYGTPGTTGTIGLLMELIHECREETRLRQCNEAGTTGGAGARGMGAVANVNTDLFYNERQSYTATCPTGQTGDSVTVVKEANTVGSALSVADANARALQMAQDEANSRLSCEDEVVTYYNTAKVGTASCPGAQEDGTPASTGPSVSATIEAGRYSSVVSQQAADDAAQAAADALAAAQLTCTYRNKEQTYEAVCPSGTIGDNQEVTIGAGVYSASSQSEANQLALAEAQRQAEALLVCGDFIIGNTPQNGQASVYCAPAGCPARTLNASATVPANYYTRRTTEENLTADQLALNNQARSLADQQAFQFATALCQQYTVACMQSIGGGVG